MGQEMSILRKNCVLKVGFQDIGSRLKEIRYEEGDGFLTSEILEQLIAGTFSMDISPLCESENIYEEIEDLTLPAWIDLSSVLKEVSKFVRDATPGWFEEHITLFKQQTDGMFDTSCLDISPT